MKLIKTGVTRWVFLTQKYAIKLPRPDYGWRLFVEGIRANLNEQEFYNIAKIPDNQLSKALPHICPILWVSWGSWIIIMPRCEPLIIGLVKFETRTGDIRHQLLSNSARECFLVMEKLVGDHKDDNYGIYNGKVVMLDYGSTNIDLYEGQKEVIY